MEAEGEEVRDDNDAINPGRDQTAYGVGEVGITQLQECRFHMGERAGPGEGGGGGAHSFIRGFDPGAVREDDVAGHVLVWIKARM